MTRSCCSVENGSLALGIVSAVAACKTILGSMILELYGSVGVYKWKGNGKTLDGDIDWHIRELRRQHYFWVLFGIGVIHLTFSVFLCNGVVKRNACQVLVYYVYSIIMLIVNLVIITSVLLLIFNSAVVVLSIIYFIIHGLLLTMVYKTYKKFNSERTRSDEMQVANRELKSFNTRR